MKQKSQSAQPPLSSLQSLSSAQGSFARNAPKRLAFVLLGVIALAAAFLIYRSQRTLPATRTEARLSLGPNVPVLEAPPPPGDDRLEVQESLQRIAALQARIPQKAGPADHLVIARAAMEAGDPLTAYEQFHAALPALPNPDPNILNDCGYCALQLALYPQAKQNYQRLIAQLPLRAAGYIGLTRAEYNMGATRQAEATLEQASQNVPAGNIGDRLDIAQEFERKGALERSLAICQAALAAAPNDPQAMKLTAHLLSRLARLADARRLLEQLVAAHPEDAGVHLELAAVVDNPAMPGRDRGLAEDLLLKVLQGDPGNAQALRQLGAICQEQRRYKQAAYIYARLLQLMPDSASARMQLAQAYDGLGDARRATDQRQIAQQLLARDRTEERLSAAANHHATDPQARLALARYFVHCGQFGDALAQFQAAFCLAPGSAETRRALAAVYDQIGAPELKADIARFEK